MYSPNSYPKEMFKTCCNIHLLTNYRVSRGIHGEGDGDEDGEDLLGGARRPAHQPRDSEHAVHHDEERVPQAHRAVHGEEVQLEVLADSVNDCRSEDGVFSQILRITVDGKLTSFFVHLIQRNSIVRDVTRT